MNYVVYGLLDFEINNTYKYLGVKIYTRNYHYWNDSYSIEYFKRNYKLLN